MRSSGLPSRRTNVNHIETIEKLAAVIELLLSAVKDEAVRAGAEKAYEEAMGEWKISQ